MASRKPGEEPEIRVPPATDVPPVEEIPENADIPPVVEPPGAAPEGDGDNAWQESDEALPDDEEERAIDEDPEREERRFGD